MQYFFQGRAYNASSHSIRLELCLICWFLKVPSPLSYRGQVLVRKASTLQVAKEMLQEKDTKNTDNLRLEICAVTFPLFHQMSLRSHVCNVAAYRALFPY